MSLPRRYLPPLSTLLAFDAAARHANFTLAAEELSLTPSAVSRKIRELEGILGSELFQRERKRVRLTAAGERYATAVRAALGRIVNATVAFRANPEGGSLHLAILPTFGARWLGPRLPAFLAANPGVTLNLSTKLAPFDFGLETVDAAVHYGRPDWPGAELDFLMPETVAPACSPALRDSLALRHPSDLARAPLLHLASRPDAWPRWFTAMGLDGPPARGMLLDQFALASRAASAGLGVALLPEFLIQSELAAGDLVMAAEGRLSGPEAYYLAWPATRRDYPPLQAFRTWLRDAAQAFASDQEVPGDVPIPS